MEISQIRGKFPGHHGKYFKPRNFQLKNFRPTLVANFELSTTYDLFTWLKHATRTTKCQLGK